MSNIKLEKQTQHKVERKEKASFSLTLMDMIIVMALIAVVSVGVAEIIRFIS